MGVSRRRYTLESQDASARAAIKLGTHTAWAMHLAAAFQGTPGNPDHLDHTTMLALIAVAHHQDMHMAAGQSAVITYPEDVGDIVGWTPTRAGQFMRNLVRVGLLKGSAQAGYVLAGAMVDRA